MLEISLSCVLLADRHHGLKEGLVLGFHDERAVRAAALASGADVLVLKQAIPTDLLPAVERARRDPVASGTTPIRSPE